MSVTAPGGFVAGGIACGIKPDGAPDLTLVATHDGKAVPAAAVFTPNEACAAPVAVSRAHLALSDGHAAAVVLSSGCANAGTGAQGIADAAAMAELTASGLGCTPDQVLVCSTGLIGYPMPMAPVGKGIGELVKDLGSSAAHGAAAAWAIMTTDTVPKTAVVHGEGFIVGGMAKGAAMLSPAVATMLAVLTTDAAVDPGTLGDMLGDAVDGSFNALVVDGCMSTNDTVIALASGASGTVPDWHALQNALSEACASLAEQMAADAEGATKLAHVRITGAATAEQARACARSVASSVLVRCSLFGEDPYWGRVLSELGAARAGIDQSKVSISYGGVVVAAGGVAAVHDAREVAAHMAGRTIEIACDLGLGTAEALVRTCDLSYAYIDENKGTS